MSMENLGLYREAVRHELDVLRGHWRWFVILGLALVALGAIALSSLVIASLATAVVLGVLMLMSGVTETLGAFWCRAWSGFTFLLLSGLLSIVVGVMFIVAPIEALATLTLLVACFLIVGGTFKIVAATSYRFATWGWPLVSGIIDLVLGLMIWRQWPACSLWVIGLFVGIILCVPRNQLGRHRAVAPDYG